MIEKELVRRLSVLERMMARIVLPEVSEKVIMGMVNGGHSDFATAQAAVDWAEANGYQHIYFPAGTYDNITISTEMLIEGAGAATVFQDTAGHCVEVDQRRVTLKNFAVQGTSGGGNAYDCIRFNTDYEGGFVQGILFRSSDRYGLYCDADFVTMTGCVFRTPAFDLNKIYLGTNSEDCIVVGNANIDADVIDNGAGNVVAGNS